MRLPVETFRRLSLGLTASLVLSGCAVFSGGDDGLVGLAPADASAANLARGAGPSADYPVVVGDAYRVGAKTYTPADTLNYDEVGHAIPEAGIGVTASHHTLPLPSYVEVTSLDTNEDRAPSVERRGPMTSDALIALSPMALTQLGGSAGTPVRVRRVNPQEEERAMLRIGQGAPNRMDTPESLLAVLKRKLPANGSAQLAAASSPATPRALAQVPLAPSQAARELPASPSPQASSRPSAPVVPASASPASLPRPALPPLGRAAGASMPAPANQPTVVARLEQPAPQPVRAVPPPSPAPTVATPRPAVQAPAVNANGAFVVQVAALSSLKGAERLAGAIGGRVTRAGSFYRVRTGPFTTRGQAEASLAKVRAAGYSDARIFTNG